MDFEYAAQEATLLDYRTEVERAADRIERLAARGVSGSAAQAER